MADERRLTPEELAALFKRLDALIEEAQALQREINDRLTGSRRAVQQDRSGQPARRRGPRKK